MTREYNNICIIHKRVKELLKIRGITQLQLAEALNQDKDYLNSCFRKGLVNRNLLVRIAEYLDCNPIYLNKEDAPLLEYATYECGQYDEMECLNGLIYHANYKPSDFDLSEKTELFSIIDKCIRDLADKKNKQRYDLAFWAGEGSKGGIAYIEFEKEGGDTDGSL